MEVLNLIPPCTRLTRTVLGFDETARENPHALCIAPSIWRIKADEPIAKPERVCFGSGDPLLTDLQIPACCPR